jgi:DNA-binding transcriptional MocR family regulator
MLDGSIRNTVVCPEWRSNGAKLLFSPQEKFRNCFRLSVALPWDSRVDNALARLGALVGRHAVRT